MKRDRLYTDITRRLAGSLPGMAKMAMGLATVAKMALGMAALAILATGCSDEGENTPQGEEELVPLVIEEVKMDTWAGNTTRATQVENKTPTKLWVFKEGETTYKVYTLSSGKWTSADPLLLRKDEKIRAFGGFNSPAYVANSASFDIRPIIYDDIDNPDMSYLYNAVPYYSEYQTVNTTRHSISFQMKPLYARLTVMLKKSYECTWDGVVEYMQINDFKNYTYNVQNNTYTEASNNGVFNSFSPKITIEDNEVKVLDVIIPAGDGSQPSEHAIIITDDSEIPVGQRLNYTPRAGEWTTIHMTMKPQGIVFTGSEAVQMGDFQTGKLPELELQD